MSYPIQPKDLKVEDLYEWESSSITDHPASGVAARTLVVMAQKHKSWRDFTKTEIDAVSEEELGEQFLWCKLSDENEGVAYIKDNGDNTFSFSHGFVDWCFTCHPMD